MTALQLFPPMEDMTLSFDQAAILHLFDMISDRDQRLSVLERRVEQMEEAGRGEKSAPAFTRCACGNVAMIGKPGQPWRCIGCGRVK